MSAMNQLSIEREQARAERQLARRRLTDLKRNELVKSGPDKKCPCCGHTMQTWSVA
ncbi:MAG: hypothetical protein ACREJC_04235 [Tepidisphaeraceae bacterium]